MPRPPVEIKPGVVFWLNPAGECTKPHPWFVLSKPVQGKVFVVNVTDVKNYVSTCNIVKGEHPDIAKTSAVYYRAYKERDAKGMSKALASGVGVRHCADASNKLINRIIVGLISSADVPDAKKILYGFMQQESTKPDATF